MHVDEAIRSRVSVRGYEDAPVPEDTILELLELAVLAPNHRMTEPLRFRIMGEEAKRFASLLQRPNILFKVPATPAGVPGSRRGGPVRRAG